MPASTDVDAAASPAECCRATTRVLRRRHAILLAGRSAGRASSTRIPRGSMAPRSPSSATPTRSTPRSSRPTGRAASPGCRSACSRCGRTCWRHSVGPTTRRTSLRAVSCGARRRASTGSTSTSSTATRRRVRRRLARDARRRRSRSNRRTSACTRSTVEPATPLGRRIASGEAPAPDDDDQADEVRGRRRSPRRRPGSTGTRSRTGRARATSAATTSSTGPAATTSRSAAPRHGHRDGRRWWNVRTPERYIERVERRRRPGGGSRGARRRQRGPRSRLTLALRTRGGRRGPARRHVDERRAALERRRTRRLTVGGGRADRRDRPAPGHRGHGPAAARRCRPLRVLPIGEPPSRPVRRWHSVRLSAR